MASSVQIQTVLYGDSIDGIRRFVRSLQPTIDHARAAGLLSHAEVHLGDCSGSPALDDAAVGEFTGLLAGTPLRYRFFDADLMSARGHNTLAEEVVADTILVVHPDTYVAPPLLAELLRTLADPTVGIAEARQIPVEHAKAYDPVTGETSWASGCCFLVPTELFHRLGGFDAEHFPLHGDDVDLSWRVRLAGRRVLHVPTATVLHDKRLTIRGAVRASETERYGSVFAGLMLARRYGRPDVESDLVAWVTEHGMPAHRRDLDEFRSRDRAGRTAAPLGGAEGVAEFVDGAHARHRF